MIAAASSSALAAGGTVVAMTGPSRSPAYCERKGASMLVATAPGATTFARTPRGV